MAWPLLGLLAGGAGAGVASGAGVAGATGAGATAGAGAAGAAGGLGSLMQGFPMLASMLGGKQTTPQPILGDKSMMLQPPPPLMQPGPASGLGQGNISALQAILAGLSGR